MVLSQSEAIARVGDELLEAWQREKRKLDKIDKWARWDHDAPHRPRQATPEYKELAARSEAPWGALIITSVAQTLFVEGYRRPDAPEDSSAWQIWQANGWDARQVAVHRAVLTYGLTYGTCVPGTTLSGDPMPVIRGVSPREMIALYEEPADDEWPVVALRVRRTKKDSPLRLALFDDGKIHHLTTPNPGEKITYVREEIHDVGVTPVVRYTNRFDLEGRAAGEIEPFIPLLGRIDQTVFDRLVVQRFASWVVRTIAGMDLSKTAEENGTTIATALVRLRAQDILTAPDADTKFGSLPASPLEGFIKGEERDLTDLSAVSQTPAFELLGQMANMGAEALAAAKSSQTAKSNETKHTLGEGHEQLLRLADHVAGNQEGASDFMAEVRWADTSIRSLAQAVDALGKLATMLGFPPELLWSKVPGFTKQDVDEAKKRLEDNGGIDQLMREFLESTAPPEPSPANG